VNQSCFTTIEKGTFCILVPGFLIAFFFFEKKIGDYKKLSMSRNNLHMVKYYNNIMFYCFSYEAWVIYNFLSLCLGWVGGPGAVVLSLSGRVLKPSWYLMTCCFPPIPLDG
jgi:hypothetical protein